MQKRIKILQSSLVEEKVFSVQQKLDEATTFPQERICVISKNGKIVEKAGFARTAKIFDNKTMGCGS